MSRYAVLSLRGRGVRGSRTTGPMPGGTSYQSLITHSEDDAHEHKGSGVVERTDPVLWLGAIGLEAPNEAVTGVRWRDVSVSQGEVIDSARIFFRTWSKGNTYDLTLRIWGEASDNALAYEEIVGNISGRAKTTAYVDWVVPEWQSGTHGEHTTSPDLSAVVQEIINRPGWAAGHNLAFLIEWAPGYVPSEFPLRRAWAVDGSSADAARLSVNEAEPAPPPAPEPDPDPPTLDMRGDPSFTASSLDDTTVDALGVTRRGWYDRLMNAVSANVHGAYANRDVIFDRNDYRPWNRTGQGIFGALLGGFRVTGDLQLLDETCRLMQIAWARRTVVDGYLSWSGNHKSLDAVLAWGMIAAVMWACENNRDLASPAGYNYGALADNYLGWLLNHAFPQFGGGTLPVNTKGQQHCYPNMMRAQWYVAKAGGGWGFTPQEYIDTAKGMLDTKLSHDATCLTGFGGRATRFWTHNVVVLSGTGPQGTGIQGMTYHRSEVPAYVDLVVEGFYPEALTMGFMREWAACIADFAYDDDPAGTGAPYASVMIGDHEHGSYHCDKWYYGTYYGRPQASHAWGSAALLQGFDTRGRGISYPASHAPAVFDSTPPTVVHAGARLFDSFFFA